ncbi:MAG: hypothetical protein WA699_09200, partial [Pseudolabrys sp.]
LRRTASHPSWPSLSRPPTSPLRIQRTNDKTVAILHRVTTEFRFFVFVLAAVSYAQVFLRSPP